MSQELPPADPRATRPAGAAGVALERAAWSALGIVLGLVIAELFWRLPPHLPRTGHA
jgi:hypothetical protein